jgi:hypothetical protein
MSVVSILSYVLSKQALSVLYIGHCGYGPGRSAQPTMGDSAARPGHAYLAAGQPQTHPGIVQHTAPHVNTH